MNSVWVTRVYTTGTQTDVRTCVHLEFPENVKFIVRQTPPTQCICNAFVEKQDSARNLSLDVFVVM